MLSSARSPGTTSASGGPSWPVGCSTPSRPGTRGPAVANVLLGVTGSVAAIRTPDLFETLQAEGHAVRVVATAAALYFFDPVALAPLPGEPPRRNPDRVILDEDEWPGRADGRRWQRDEPVLHIELRRWADLFLIAPL